MANQPIYFLYAVLAVWGIVITATYLLRAVRWAFFGPLNPTWEGKVEDARGIVFRAPFVFLIVVLVLFGCYPKLLVDYIDNGVQHIFSTIDAARIATGR
jgi:NADH-quinone oxidoreductase subunit M